MDKENSTENNKRDYEQHLKFRCPLCLSEDKRKRQIFDSKRKFVYHLKQHDKCRTKKIMHYLSIYDKMLQVEMIPQ